MNSNADALKTREKDLERTEKKLNEQKRELELIGGQGAPPLYWNSRSLRLDQPANLVDAQDLVDEVQRLTTATCISQHIGIGRDSHGLKHKGFRVIKVQRLENLQFWSQYYIEREIVRANMPRGQAEVTRVDTYSRMLWQQLQVDRGVNEALVWHGTKAEKREVICKQGLDERVATAGYFGRGIYFAENSSKSDEYVVPDREGLCYMFLARVCLGVAYSSLQPTSHLTRPPNRSDNPHRLYDSVRGECMQHWKYSKHNASLQRYREFIVFDCKLTYPELLITFRRVS
eukprot:g51334.t1